MPTRLHPPPRAGEELYEGERIVPNKGRELQVAPTSRKRFDPERRRVFLEWFSGTANLSLSAREAGVHYRTVLRHRAEDAGFRADFDEALDQGKARLRAWAMEAKDDGRTEYDPAAHAPAHLDSGQVLQLLRDDAQREAAVRRAEGGSSGGRGGRVPTVASNAEVREALIAALIAHGLRVRESLDTASRPGSTAAPDEREGEADREAESPLHQASLGPPPRPGEEL